MPENALIALIFFVIGTVTTLFINKRRDKKNELKKQSFRLNFESKPLYEEHIRTIHKDSHDKENKFDQKKFEDTLSRIIPILQITHGCDYDLLIHNLFRIRATPLFIVIKSSCLPFKRTQGMMGYEKSVQFKRYSSREFNEFKSEIKQYGSIEIQVAYKHNNHSYIEIHSMQIAGDHIEILFDKKTEIKNLDSFK